MTQQQTPDFVEGQRWVSDTETGLGLGIIAEVEFRQVTIIFPAAGEKRIYSRDNSPLTRIVFAAGDTIKGEDQGTLKVESITNQNGYIIYHGKLEDGSDATIEELDLDNRLRFNTPRDRLFAGQLDSYRWYRLRTSVYEYRQERQQSAIRGLSGARVAVIPHQIFIAVEVSNRLHPRVLLADEVGLGKTIEAGLILQRQLAQHRISRVLVVVPETLIHQWLVEMLRKFNLHFHIIDKDRVEALKDSAPDGNPFLAQQLVLCSLETLRDNEEIAADAASAEWDCLTVDEAHHLQWTPENPSPEYRLIENIARLTPAVLLLTATPEQLGQASHFARLKLLDPERYTDLDTFIEEENSFEGIAKTANLMLSNEDIDAKEVENLSDVLGKTFTESESKLLQSGSSRAMSDLTDDILHGLVDRHGTGRVLFRNTRNTISGFPARELSPIELPEIENPGPEARHAQWTDVLRDLLTTLSSEKLLVICSSPDTVQALQENLRALGTDCAVFHEGMSIVERDRSAAWFADTEDGCRLLICSEIGSEGRNFQFLHNLVLLELPENPDLLEQRIGRLDRIGQQQDVQIHVPFYPQSSEHHLMRWYHEGLNAFESCCHVGSNVKRSLQKEFDAVFAVEDAAVSEKQVATLISQTQTVAEELNQQLDAGRDRLLELNSNRVSRVQQHLDMLEREERDFTLQDFMGKVFDCFGVDYEEQSNGSWIARPSDNMHIDHFPGVPEGGVTLTFQRAQALEREELVFLTWDHPMIENVMDMILDEALGQANASAISNNRFPKGIMLIEATYTYECIADRSLDTGRYLAAGPDRFLLGSNKKDYTEALAELESNSVRQKIEVQKLKQVVKGQQEIIRFLLDHSEKMANHSLGSVIEDAKGAMEAELQAEIDRLQELKKVNPAVRETEIEALDTLKRETDAALSDTSANLVAVRIMVNV